MLTVLRFNSKKTKQKWVYAMQGRQLACPFKYRGAQNAAESWTLSDSFRHDSVVLSRAVDIFFFVSNLIFLWVRFMLLK